MYSNAANTAFFEIGIGSASHALSALFLGSPIGPIGGAILGGLSYTAAQPIRLSCKEFLNHGKPGESKLSKIVSIALIVFGGYLAAGILMQYMRYSLVWRQVALIGVVGQGLDRLIKPALAFLGISQNS